MDAFSWFRQKRQGLRPAPTPEVRIPLILVPTVGFVVYFRLRPEEPQPGERELLSHALDWLDQHTPDGPLAEGVRAFLDQGMVSLILHDRASIPEPPDEIVRAYNPGETEERRFRNATHVVLVGSPDLLAPPRIGLWAVLAAARGLATALPGGVLVDPLFPRILPLEARETPLPMSGQVRVLDHILIPYSLDSVTGRAWMTTKGMARFGLPELEIRDVPPNLVNGLMPVMNGMAQRLADAAMRFTAETGLVLDESTAEARAYLPLKAQFRFTLADVRRAYATPSLEDETDDGASEEAEGDDAEDVDDVDDETLISVIEDATKADEEDEDDNDAAETSAEPTKGKRPGTTILRLERSLAGRRRQEGAPGGGDADLFIRIAPPRGIRAGAGVWLNRVLAELFGSDPQVVGVETGDAEMENAHQTALRDLPLVRARFRAGFRSGEVLHVKHGFPTGEDGHEYMWIVVTTWNDGRIHGHVANDPQYRRDLRAGQEVDIGEDEVYDWLIVHSDGRTEGAFTNRLLRDDDSPEEE